jgi:hypothetical protein
VDNIWLEPRASRRQQLHTWVRHLNLSAVVILGFTPSKIMGARVGIATCVCGTVRIMLKSCLIVLVNANRFQSEITLSKHKMGKFAEKQMDLFDQCQTSTSSSLFAFEEVYPVTDHTYHSIF